MNKDNLLRGTFTSYAFLVSSLIFGGVPTNGKNTFSAVLFTVITFFVVLFAAYIYLKLSEKSRGADAHIQAPRLISAAMCFLGFVACLGLYGAATLELSETLPVISVEFEGGRFSHFFVILSLLLSFYIGKRGGISYSRVCLLFLPLLVLPYILTFFDFIGYKTEYFSADMLPSFIPMPEVSYFIRGVYICGGIFALFVLLKNNEINCSGKRGLPAAFVLLALTAAIEAAKYILWFGAEGLSFVERPDRTMLAAVPFINIQEIFLFSYYFAYMLKITVFCTAARLLFEKAVSSVRKKPMPRPVSYFSAAVGAYLVYAFSSAMPRRIPIYLAVSLIYALMFFGMVLYELIRLFSKKVQKRQREKTEFSHQL